MPNPQSEVVIPCVFFGPEKLSSNVLTNDVNQYKWLIDNALPLLKGNSLSKPLENQLFNCIQQLPTNASIQFVGIMLSRSTDGIRLYINRLHPEQILPYLKSLGWSDETGQCSVLISELKNKADRFVIGFDINIEGISPRIGIECSFISNRFHNETRWNNLLNYLVKKGICLPEKRDALLSYSGICEPEYFSGGLMKPLSSASNHLEKLLSSALVRYISHVKILYEKGHILEAKAYPAVRLFENPNEIMYD